MGDGTRSRRAALSLGPGTGFGGRGDVMTCWLVPCGPDARWALAQSRTRLEPTQEGPVKFFSRLLKIKCSPILMRPERLRR